jgi:hypothetical protein
MDLGCTVVACFFLYSVSGSGGSSGACSTISTQITSAFGRTIVSQTKVELEKRMIF